MDNKDIAISVIVQDMRFNQYHSALRKLGIEAYDFELELMGIVASLIGKTNEGISDEWMELYVTEICKSEAVMIEPLGRNLFSLAEQCYNSLMNFNDDDNVGGALS